MAAKYNILYLHDKTDISGGEQSLLNLWEHIDKNRFTLHLITRQEGDFAKEARRKGVVVSFHSFPKISVLNLFKVMQSIGYLKKFVAEHKIHLIHSYGPRNNIISSLAAKQMAVPVIWHERNIPTRREWDVTRALLQWPDIVICNSQAVANRFLRQGKLPSKVRVVLNGVNLKRFIPADIERPKTSIVGIVSNLSPRRRIEYFIEAADKIYQARPDTTFFIVGGEFEEKNAGRHLMLQGMIDRLGLRNSVVMSGFQTDVRPSVASFDVCCHVTSKDACSRAVLEAMAMGKAIVAMDDGGTPELIEHERSGLLVNPNDQDGFVQAVVRLLDSQVERQRLGAEARKKAELEFDVVKNAQQTQDIYISLIDVNKAVYDSEGTVRSYGQESGLRPAEKTIVSELQSQLGTMRMLDVGVGAGRTTKHFAPLVKEYVGIDYAPKMISLCQNIFPHLSNQLEIQDVRFLRYEDQSFDFVLVSFNGLDYMGHDDRQKAFAEIKRVLRPGGVLCFSTHNLEYVRHFTQSILCRNIAHWGYRFARARHAREILNEGRSYAVIRDGGDDFKLLTYYINPQEQLTVLKQAGFKNTRLFSEKCGQEIKGLAVDDFKDERWLYYLCHL